MFIKVLLLIFKPIITLFWLMAIVVMNILFFSLSTIYLDVSKKPEYQYLTKPIFETETDLFLFQCLGSRTYTLGNVGPFYLPSSVEAYKKDPENWIFTDDLAEKRQLQGYFPIEKVLAIIPKGTHLKVIKIKKNSFTGHVKGYFARLENSPFSKHLVNIDTFLESCSNDKVPELRKGHLKPINAK